MRRIQIIVCSALWLAGCTDKQAEPPRLPGDDKVLATVNGTTITQYDVERTAKDMFGAAAKSFDDETKQKMLESLVHTRALSQARQQEMSPVELAELDKKVAAYREELLTTQYLARHAHTQGASPDLVRKYYDDNAEKFGAVKVRSYELIAAPSAATAAQRSELIGLLGSAAQERDWSAWSQKLAKEGKQVTVRRGQDDDRVLHPKLQQLIAQVKTGETSKPTIIDGVPYVARVGAETVKAARPFEEVQDEIAKTLAPEQIKEAVRQVSGTVLKNAEVAYR